MSSSSSKPKRTKAEKLEASKIPHGLTGISWGTVKETGIEAEDKIYSIKPNEHGTYSVVGLGGRCLRNVLSLSKEGAEDFAKLLNEAYEEGYSQCGRDSQS